MSLHKIKEAVQAADGNARQMGEVVLMIAQADEHAAEVIAADLLPGADVSVFPAREIHCV